MNGLLDRDFTQDFHIMITNPVFAAGYYGYPEDPEYPTSNIKYKACYWINGELKDDLDHSGLTYRNSYAYGIVYVNGRLYISGFWNTKDGNPSGSGVTHGDHNYDQDNNPCYWVDGQRVDLPKDGVKNTRTLSIAVVGEKVYITGAEIGQRPTSGVQNISWGYNDRYLWIHDRGSGSSPQRIKLEPPAGYNAFSTSPVNDRFEGRFAVDNSGHVYIPMGVSTDGLNRTGYYWDEYGIDHKIDVSTPDPWFYEANSAAIINGNVYFAGYMQMTGISQPQLFYTVLGSDSHTNLYAPNADNRSRVNSIVNQNGVPRFYGYSSPNNIDTYYSWDTSGSGTPLPATYYYPDTRSVVYADGDVYMTMKYSDSVYYIKNNYGYTALGGNTRLLIDVLNNARQPTNGAVTAIAVPGSNSGGNVVTVPVTGVTLNKTSLALQTGETEILTASIAPSNATRKAIAWVSSHPHVAAVSGGVVTAHSAGTSVITVTTADGSRTASCTVTVTDYDPAPVMVDIPGGTFTMGSPSGEDDRVSWNENQWGPVTISAFRMGKYEITRRQWIEVMGVLPPSSAIITGNGDSYPVYGTSWIAAVAFCNKLSIREGLTPAYNYNGVTNPDNWGAWSKWTQAEINANITFVPGSSGYRLPTEAQWEYACRAGTTTAWYFGATSAALGDHAWYYLNSGSATHPVGQKLPNAWGLHDMLGNVAEWCWDVFPEEDNSYECQYVTTTTTDPTGPVAVNESNRVLRGYHYRVDSYAGNNDPKFFRSAYRHNSSPASPFVIYGIRVVLPGN